MAEGSLEHTWEPTNRHLIQGRPPWGKSAQHDNALGLGGHPSAGSGTTGNEAVFRDSIRAYPWSLSRAEGGGLTVMADRGRDDDATSGGDHQWGKRCKTGLAHSRRSPARSARDEPMGDRQECARTCSLEVSARQEQFCQVNGQKSAEVIGAEGLLSVGGIW